MTSMNRVLRAVRCLALAGPSATLGVLESLWETLGPRRLVKQRLERALQHAEVLGRVPEQALALHKLGVLVRVEDSALSVTYLRRLVSICPLEPWYRMELAFSLEAAGELGGAIAAVREAEQLATADSFRARAERERVRLEARLAARR